MKIMEENILKGREVKWAAVKISRSEFSDNGNNAILKRVIEGFLPIKDEEENDVEYYIILNRNINRGGFFETIKKKGVKEINVPFFWKLMFWIGKGVLASGKGDKRQTFSYGDEIDEKLISKEQIEKLKKKKKIADRKPDDAPKAEKKPAEEAPKTTK